MLIFEIFHPTTLWRSTTSNYSGKVIGWEEGPRPLQAFGGGAAGESHVTAALRLLCHNLCNTLKHFAIYFRLTRVQQRCDIVYIWLILGADSQLCEKCQQQQQQNLAGIS